MARRKVLDYDAMLKLMKESIAKSVYKDDVIVNSLIVDFERMVKINNELFKQLEIHGYTMDTPSGIKASTLIGVFNKNHSVMAKTCETLQTILEKVELANEENW